MTVEGYIPRGKPDSTRGQSSFHQPEGVRGEVTKIDTGLGTMLVDTDPKLVPYTVFGTIFYFTSTRRPVGVRETSCYRTDRVSGYRHIMKNYLLGTIVYWCLAPNLVVFK